MFVRINIKEFQDLLRSEKGWEMVCPKGQEIYFDFVKGQFIIRVHSSIEYQDRPCRRRGMDAIRVSLLTEVDGIKKGLRKFSRVTRQEKWRRHLKSRVMDAYNYSKTVPICPNCGSPMSLRTAKETKNQFFGCVRYPLCRGSRQL